MNVNCQDRDRIFENGTAEQWAALAGHAQQCRACAEETSAWNLLSVAAQEMRDYADDPALWQRIEQRLGEETERKRQRAERWGWLSSWTNVSLGWRTAAAGVLLAALTFATGWILFHGTGEIPADNRARLLKSGALAEVEKTEAAYTQAIDKLALESKVQLDNPANPLLASYREKLLVLDSAISNLREQARLNPSNAHISRQLLAMYREKQNTLEEVLEEKR